ncbi:hypothetical protein GTY75_09125 [Streptomyces sp. SID8381]|uniref:hypothetical protein n=1 Tax=unclassified Streptomyces TaxID=2593676 RepID=UPI00037DA1C2|nr:MULTISPECIES: hypothetical protein [unclassified Streptomyces]MYX26828.1 hypothetical protein [Streptomyces sp. SID8381]
MTNSVLHADDAELSLLTYLLDSAVTGGALSDARHAAAGRLLARLRALPRPDAVAPPAEEEAQARAASLFVGAFNSVYEDDPRMTIALHRSNGSSLAVAGLLDDYRMRFDPAEVSTLLSWLTRAVAADPDAIISVTTAYRPFGGREHGWAWRVGTGAALDREEAASLFGPGVDLLGAAESHVTLGSRPLDTSAAGLTATALTSDVKAVVAAHGESERPAAGHWVALRTEGTITFHVAADDVPAARAALEALDFEGFDVDLLAEPGLMISCVTVREPEDAKVLSVDGIPADELG